MGTINSPNLGLKRSARILLFGMGLRTQSKHKCFASAIVYALDGDPHSYLEVADAIRQYGASAEEDCAQLWRRVVFNILISNSDDHLRNHGFLYWPGGWRLAPAYDFNPVPLDIKPRVLTTAIDEVDGTASLDLALETAAHYKLTPDQARAVAREVGRSAVARHGKIGWLIVRRNRPDGLGLRARRPETRNRIRPLRRQVDERIDADGVP